MAANRKQFVVAGFIIGLVLGLMLTALVIGGYAMAKRGRRVIQPAVPAGLAEGEDVRPLLAVYESFDGTITATGTLPQNPEFVPGKFGEALRVRLADPLTVAMPPDFLQAATVMAWVRIDNQRDRSMIWYYDALYPSSVNYPDHQYKLSMQFLSGANGLSWTLAPAMQPNRFYHLAQSWGPDGFKAYLDGSLTQSDDSFRSGQTLRPGASTQYQLYLGSAPNTTPHQSGPGWQLNNDGVYFDDFAVVSGQLSDAEIAGIAQSNAPLDVVR